MKASAFLNKIIVLACILLTGPFLIAQETPSVMRSRISLSIIQKDDQKIDLRADFRVRKERSYARVAGIPIDFTLSGDTSNVELGQTITDQEGAATLEINAKDWILVDTQNITFQADFTGNDSISSSSRDASILRASLSMEGLEVDSLQKQIQVTFTGVSGGSWLPVAEAEVSLYLRRWFSNYKVGSETTDGEGIALIDFPSDFSGDNKGHLTLIARVEEHDIFGDVQTVEQLPWGQPIVETESELPRALWSTNTPMWMLVTFIVLMGTVWGHYLIIVLNLLKIKREGKHLHPNNKIELI